MKEKIDADLTRLFDIGMIEPVQIAESGATPIVPVLKPNSAVRTF